MRRFLALALGVLLFDAYLAQPDETSNARTRLALTKALVLEGTLRIDSFHEGIWDKAYYRGHYYCDKAPLTSFLAVPPYAALHALGVRDELLLAYLVRLTTVSLATALSLPLFGAYLRRLGVTEPAALLACAAGWFGTALLPYGTVFFGHNLTFALLVAALACWERPAAMGLLLGLSVTADYQAVLVALLATAVVLADRGPRHAARLVAGALPPALLLLGYHQLLFGNPFTLPVRYEVDAAVHAMAAPYGSGFYGMSLPRPAALYLLLLSPAKGLFYLSPPLAAAALAWRAPAGAARAPWLLAWLVVPTYVLLIAAAPSYHGGFSFGPRLLIPILPFLLLLLSLGLDRLPGRYLRYGWATVVPSFLAYAGAAATLIAIPYDFHYPLGEIVLPRLLTGDVTWNLGTVLGLGGLWSLLPLAAGLAGCAALALPPTGGESPNA